MSHHGPSTRSAVVPEAADKDRCYVPDATSRRDHVDALVTVSRAFAGRLEVRDVLAVALELTAEVVGSEGSSVLVIDPESGGMSFYAASGEAADALQSIPLPPGAGICGEVVRTGRPLSSTTPSMTTVSTAASTKKRL